MKRACRTLSTVSIETARAAIFDDPSVSSWSLLRLLIFLTA